MPETTYDDIQLNPQEQAEAIAQAKEQKFYRLLEQEKEARASELRRMLTEQWTTERTEKWITSRVNHIFLGESLVFTDLVDDESGKVISNSRSMFNLFCEYFSMDPKFIESAEYMGVKRPDLRKGLLLIGAIGCGKTTMLRLFQRNQRQVFMMKSAKEIAWKWLEAEKNAGEYLHSLSNIHLLPADDVQNFYHRYAGLCIDDAGTEDIKNNYGNKSNVITDIIEGRYYNGAMGPMFHMTTNLNTGDLKAFYGDRAASRLRECMNIIEYKGEDRRK